MRPDEEKNEEDKELTPEERKRRFIEGVNRASSGSGLPFLQKLRSDQDVEKKK